MIIDKILVSGFGSGYFPFASGTFGSFVALGIIWLIQPNEQNLIILIVLSLAIGIRASTRLEKVWGHDPSKVVLDEFVGMWIAVLWHDLNNFTILAIAFFVFRFFDVLKPLGINRLQNLPGGWGVMLDDVLAGIYTNICVFGYIYFQSY